MDDAWRSFTLKHESSIKQACQYTQEIFFESRKQWKSLRLRWGAKAPKIEELKKKNAHFESPANRKIKIDQVLQLKDTIV